MQINPGVTRAKSFVFGVGAWGTPRGDRRNRRDRKGKNLPRISADVRGSGKGNFSASQRLRGELSACFSTQLHRDAQAEKGGMSSYNQEARAKSPKPGARS